MKLTDAEIEALNAQLIDIGFEGEGGLSKAPNTYLLGNFTVQKVTQVKSLPEQKRTEQSIKTLLKDSRSARELEEFLEPIGEREHDIPTSQETVPNAEPHIKTDLTKHKIIEILKRVGDRTR